MSTRTKALLRQLKVASITLALGLVSVGCTALDNEDIPRTASSPGESTDTFNESPTASAERFVAMLRTWNSFDYEPTAGPDELLEQADVVVVGVVASVEAGRDVGLADEGPQHHVTIGIRAQTLYKGEAKEDATIYLELSRPDNVPADDFQKALTNGTRLMLFGYLPDIRDEFSTNPFAGRAHGSMLYAPDPQGLFVEVKGEALSALVGPDEMVQNWSGLSTIEQIVASLERAV